jgi:hypothetical protein
LAPQYRKPTAIVTIDGDAITTVGRDPRLAAPHHRLWERQRDDYNAERFSDTHALADAFALTVTNA